MNPKLVVFTLLAAILLLTACASKQPIPTTAVLSATATPVRTLPLVSPLAPTSLPLVSSVDTTDWPIYTSTKYGFSIKYPPDWQYQEVPNEACPMAANGVWFFLATDNWCPGYTDARVDLILSFSNVDPAANWQAEYFDNYRANPFYLGGIVATRISGVHKESRAQENAIIAKVRQFYLLALSNGSMAALHNFDAILSTFTLSPITQPPMPDAILLARTNGDLILYDLAAHQEKLVLAGLYELSASECPGCVVLGWPVRLSPDGHWFLIPTPKDGTWLAATDGTIRRQISPERLSATWAPDSQRIVFTGQRGEFERQQDKEIYVQDIVGNGEARLLARLPDAVYYPTWSPGCDGAPPTASSSCGRHVFAISSCQDNVIGDTCAVWLIDVESGQTQMLSRYRPPATEVTPAYFVWSPSGDAIWISGWPDWMAFPLDGSRPRPLVDVCNFRCDLRDLSLHTTPGGWTVEGVNWLPIVKAVAPDGASHVIAQDAYLLGTREELHQHSTEVGDAASLRVLPEADQSGQWITHEIKELHLQLRAPAAWRFLRVDGDMLTNFEVVGAQGKVALTDEQILIKIERNGAGIPFQDFDSWAAQRAELERHQVTVEPIIIDGRQAVRIRNHVSPVSEQIVIPLKHAEVRITRWPLASTHEDVFEQILASISFLSADH